MFLISVWIRVCQIVGFTILFLSCSSFSTFQGAEVLERGESRTHIGASGFIAAPIPFPEIGIRYGIGNGYDLGFKYQMLDLFQVDLKKQILTAPIAAAIDIGISGAWSGESEDGDIEGVLAFYPALILDTGPWYFGMKDLVSYARVGIDFVEENPNPELSVSHFPGWFVGRSIPFRRVNILVEISAYSPLEEMGSSDYNYFRHTIFIYGFGIDFVLDE